MTETISAADNDSDIPHSEMLYRRIPGNDGISTTWDHNQGRLRPSSAAFDDDDDDGISVFLSSIIEKLGLPVSAVVYGHPGYLVAGITVGLKILARSDDILAAWPDETNRLPTQRPRSA